MKLRLPMGLLSAVLAAVSIPAVQAGNSSSTTTIPSDLGDLMYVGDSITHGVSPAPSWRWSMHKIFVDNGISYNPVGYMSGNFKGNYVDPGAKYGDVEFVNVHSAESSARAYEVAGRSGDSSGRYGRFNSTNIGNWLGQSTTRTNGSAYAGNTYNPDTFYLLIGTNDLLSNPGYTQSDYDTKFDKLLGAADSDGKRLGGDMKTIVDAMFTSSAADGLTYDPQSASVTVLSVPCWVQGGTSGTDISHNSGYNYNIELQKWIANYNETNGTSILYVDVNKGMVDVTASQKMLGISSMFNSDGIHPVSQGDLLMASNVAKGQGLAGRTAGQVRRAADQFNYSTGDFSLSEGSTANADGTVSLAAGGTASFNWAEGTELGAGYTVEFRLPSGLGDGATGGWASGNLSISLGDGAIAGTLNISEAYIKWGSTVLYSADMSGNEGSDAYTIFDTDEAIRIAYINGNPAQSLSSGFYVWLGDMLIGEACTKNTAGVGGVLISNGTGVDVTLSGLAVAEGSYAPSTTNVTYANPTIEPYAVQAGLDAATMKWSSVAATDVVLSSSNVSNMKGSTAAVDGGVHIKVVSGSSAGNVYASNTAHTGDLWVEISGTTSAASNSFCGVQQGRNLTGNAYFRVSSDYKGSGEWGTWFGALNGGNISGDLYMEFSSSAWTSAANTKYGSNFASVAGAFGASVGGKVTMVINNGTFNSGIWAGSISGDNTSIGSTSVHIHGGTITKHVHAGGAAGTINGSTALVLTGEAYVLESIAMISAGGTGGTINGGTTLTIDGMDAGSAPAMNGYGISRYTGTLSGSDGGTVRGAKALVFKNSTHTSGFTAQLRAFDSISLFNSNISLGAGTLGGATAISLDADSTLTLTEGNYGEMQVSSSGSIILAGASMVLSQTNNDSQVAGRFEVRSGSTLDMGAGYETRSSYTVADGANLTMQDGAQSLGSVELAAGATVAVAEGARATLGGALSGALNHTGAGTLVLAAGTSDAPVTALTSISGPNIENTGVLTIAYTGLANAITNNGTITLTGVRNQTIDFTRLNGNGTVILDNAGSGNITINTATSSTFAGTVEVDTTGYWLFFNVATNKTAQPFAADAEGNYASLHLRSTSANPTLGVAMGSAYTHNNALAIGSLSSDDAGVAVCGAFSTGANVYRYLDLHQNNDTTFAGKFLNDGSNSVGIIKHGSGELTLTAANESTANLEILEGSVNLGGANGNWAGAISVADGATLAYSGGTKSLGNVSLESGSTLKVADGTLAVGSDVQISNLVLGANSAVSVAEGARATVSGSISGSLNHTGAGTLVLAAGTTDAPVTTLTGIAGSNIENTGVLTIGYANLTGTVTNNGTITLTGVRNRAIDFTHLSGNGTVILDKNGSNHITISSATPSTFVGTVDVDTTGYWLYFNASTQPFAADADGNYASLHLCSASATPGTGLAMGSGYTHDKALAIGSLSSDDAGVAVCGAFNVGANVNRYLDLHQNADTTFAGKFLNDGSNSVGIIKHGSGELTLTAANESTANLEILEGSVKLSRADGWAGEVIIAKDAFLSVGNETVTALTDGLNATITGSGAISVTTATRVYTNADITVDTQETLTTAAKLNNSRLTLTGGGSASIEVEEGSVNSFVTVAPTPAPEPVPGEPAPEPAPTPTLTVNSNIVTVDSLDIAANTQINIGGVEGTGTLVIVDKTDEPATPEPGEPAPPLTKREIGGTVNANVIIGKVDSVTGAVTETGSAMFTSGAEVTGSLTLNAESSISLAAPVNTESAVLTVKNTVTLAAGATIDLSGMESIQTLSSTSITLISSEKGISVDTAEGDNVLSVEGLNLDWNRFSWALKVGDKVVGHGGAGAGALQTVSPLLLQGGGESLTLEISLTQTQVFGQGISYDAATNTFTFVVEDDLSLATSDINVTVDIPAWNKMVSLLDAAGETIYTEASINLVDEKGVAYGAGTLSVNGYSGEKGKYLIANIPEPTTTTLSLLALAALAARRRRK